MRKIYPLIAGIMLTASVFAQAPEKMSYQAVVRNSSNNLITSKTLGMQISILQGSITGTEVYAETQTPTSNAMGLVSLEIGTGTVINGNFTSIDWANGPYFIKTETDPTGGAAYTITGTSQLMSVPYALHAKIANSLVGGISITETDPVFGASIASGITTTDTTNWNTIHELQVISINDGTITLSNTGGSVQLPDSSSTNEFQALSISNDTIYLSDGGFIKLPTSYVSSSNTPVNGNMLTFDGTNWISKNVVAGNTGLGSAVNNMIPYLTLNYCISLAGSFPSRSGLEPFLAEIMIFAGNFAPRQWALCNGQFLAISQNQALFSLLGTAYGGDGRTTFGLPDLRGRVGIHTGQGLGLTNRTLGSIGGSETNTLSISNIPAHHHTVIIQ